MVHLLSARRGSEVLPFQIERLSFVVAVGEVKEQRVSTFQTVQNAGHLRRL
jgi:hypothetical protein